MARPDRPATRSASSAGPRLAVDIAGGTLASGLVDELARWLEDPRFRAFVEANLPKIRRKFRDARSPDAVADVRLELRLGALLLADRRFEIGFETYGRGHPGPDFTIRFRSGRRTDLEVTRRRPAAAVDVNPYEAPVLAKLRQLQPSVPNVLVVATDVAGSGRAALDAATRGIVDRAEAGDEPWFARRAIPSLRVFWAGFHRLGAVVAWREAADADDRACTWVNPNARIAVAPPLLAAIERCLRDAT